MRSLANRIASSPLISTALFFVAASIALLVIQYQSPSLAGNDGYYHIQLANQLWQQGLAFRFDWLPHTILQADAFVDHHFLFHLLLIPFLPFGLLTAAKVSAAVFGALAFTAAYALLRILAVRYPGIWAAALFAISHAFLYRMLMPRAQSLSLAVMLVAVALLIQRRYRWLLPLSFLYVWLFNGFPLILVIAFIYSAIIALYERRIELRSLANALAGIVAGVVINPFFPNNVRFAWQHILPKVWQPTAVAVGNEWYPYTTAQLIEHSGLTLLLLVLGILAWATARQDGRQQAILLFLFGLVILTGIMLFRSRRFIEYLPPFVLLFAAVSIDAWWREHQPLAHRPRWQPPAGIAITALLLATALLTAQHAVADLRNNAPHTRYQAVADWLLANSPPDSIVFTSDWDDFPQLFFHDQHNRFITGLDPTYLTLADRERADLWEAIVAGRVETPAFALNAFFDADYVLVDGDHLDMLQRCLADPQLRVVYQDIDGTLFVLDR